MKTDNKSFMHYYKLSSLTVNPNFGHSLIFYKKYLGNILDYFRLF